MFLFCNLSFPTCVDLAVLKSRKNTNKKHKWARDYRLSLATCKFTSRQKNQLILDQFDKQLPVRKSSYMMLLYFRKVS